MIQIPLTPDKYQAALTRLLNMRPPDVDYLELPNGENPGKIVNPYLTLSFRYDGTDLNLEILEKHGIARWASENIIKAHLTDLLTGV